MAYRLSMFLCSVLVITGLTVPVFGQTDWPTYSHDAASTRHPPLKQIDTNNVSKLVRAWTYHMTPTTPTAEPAAAGGRGGGGGGGQKSEATPIIVDGIMYLPTPNNRVVALDPENGKEIWTYRINGANASTRGVEYWPGDAQSPATIFFGTTNGRLMALNAKTGEPIQNFGIEGWIDMKAGITNGFANGNFSLSSPPKVFKNLVITTGARVQEAPSLGFAGDKRV